MNIITWMVAAKVKPDGAQRKFSRFRQLACLLSLSLLQVFNTSVANNTTGTEQIEPWAMQYAECHKTIMRYLDWHGIALAVGSKIEDIEQQWLMDTGLLNDEPIEKFHQIFVQPEQDIDTIDSISTTCSSDPDSHDYTGQITVNSTLTDGSKLVRIFNVKGYDSYSLEVGRQNSSNETQDIAPLPQTYELQRPFLNAYYREVIRQLSGGNPTNLEFTEETVDLFFAWPTGKLMTTLVETRIESLTNNGMEIPERKQTYKTALTSADDGVRLSSQYAGPAEYDPPIPKDEMKRMNEQALKRCSELISYCWLRSYSSVPFHYAIYPERTMYGPILDERYIAELTKWMDNERSGEEGFELYRSMVLAYVQDENEKKYTSQVSLAEGHLNRYHGKRLVKGETYATYDEPVSFSGSIYGLPNFRADPASAETKYLGKSPCSSDDTEMSCAHLEYRAKERGSDELAEDETGNLLRVDLILEPHTLLLHAVDIEMVSSRFQSIANINYHYEDLAE